MLMSHMMSLVVHTRSNAVQWSLMWQLVIPALVSIILCNILLLHNVLNSLQVQQVGIL